MDPLSYPDLYRLCEEFQQLVGGQLQAVFNPLPLRYILEIRLPAQSRNLIVDLTPTKPFIVSTSFTKIKSQGAKTPVFNFLRAHFVGRNVEEFEIAQKPNRTLKVTFSGGPTLTFKCFPHGQHLVLKADDKVVNFPLRPKDKSDDLVSFIAGEKVQDWSLNEGLAEKLSGISLKVAPSGEPYSTKILKKLEKAVEALERGIAEQQPQDLERIGTLEKKASESQGKDLEEIFEEIKKIKKKSLIAGQRRQDLQSQIEKIKGDPLSVGPPSVPVHGGIGRKNKKKGDAFSGTRVRISEKWELWVGRNAWQNEDLLKMGSSHELWLHLRDYPGAHGLLRGPKKAEPTPTQVEMAARIVAILSQPKKKPFSEGEKLDFIVTPKKFVRKRKGDSPGRVVVEREQVRRIAFKILKFEVI